MKNNARLSSIAVHTLAAMGARVAGIAFQVLTLAVIARTLPMAEVGVYASISGLALIARALGSFGFDQLVLKTVPGIVETSGKNSAVNFIRSCITRVFLAQIGLTLIIVAYLSMQDNLAYNNDIMKVCTVFIVLSNSMTGVVAFALRSLDKIVSSFLPDSFVGPFLSMILIVALWQQDLLTLNSALLSLTASFIIVSVLNALNISSFFTRKSEYKPEPQSKNHLSSAVSLWLPILITQGQLKSPLYITLLVAGMSQAALVEISSKFGLVPTLITWAVTLTFGNQIPKAVAKGDHDFAQKLVVLGTWLSFIPSLLFLLVFLAVGDWVIVLLFGAGYEPAFLPSLIFILAMTINASGSISSTALLMLGKERLVLVYTFAATVVSIGGGWLAASLYGAAGVMIGVLLAAVIRDVGLSLILRKETGLYSGIYSAAGWTSAFKNAVDFLYRKRNFKRSDEQN